MEQLLQQIATHVTALGALGAAIAFIWSVVQFFSVRGREARSREFETFHKLIKELVEPPSEGASLYIDRQCAVIYELRFFPCYYPFSRRTLLGLQEKWTLTASHFPRILQELQLTLGHIDTQASKPISRVARKLRLAPPLES